MHAHYTTFTKACRAAGQFAIWIPPEQDPRGSRLRGLTQLECRLTALPEDLCLRHRKLTQPVCRLTAPPEDSYSLHRKLSGAFLACIKLRSRVPCKQLFFDVYDQYQFQDNEKAQFA